MNKDRISDIDLIIASFLDGSINKTEQEKLDAWLKEEAGNTELFMGLIKTWQLSGTINKSVDEHTHQLWKRLKTEKIEAVSDDPRINTVQSQRRKVHPVGTILKIAALVVLVFLVGGITGYMFTSDKIAIVKPQQYQIVCPKGTRSELILADGTEV